MRICSRCRQPVGRVPGEHDCPELDDDPGPGKDSSDEDEAEAA